MKRRLITSALPYVNNEPHLGNLIQVLSADAFARFCRLSSYETLYICGTDEYGTATENRAAEEKISPKELCDRYHAIHADIYKWFNIAFDKFGRTSTQIQTEVTQDIFLKLDKAGLINEKTIEQFFCGKCGKFLADRFIRGICPVCGKANARGDQCEDCGKLLDPTDLIEPMCSACGSVPSLQHTNHLYIDLPAIKEKLENWIRTASANGFWAHNAVQMTLSWIRDGLKERAITRDLKWGIPVPKPGYENKVFYVWFDAPIGYISITGMLGEDIAAGRETMYTALNPANKGKWSSWKEFVDYWWKNPDETDLFQFIGKDNIPFHTVIFPSSLLGSGDNWTMLHHMSSTEYLNYESGKFSKSRGVGVFGKDAMETGIPSDVWRFYLFYCRPEKSDAMFTWSDFKEKVNGELIGNFGNLVNRTMSFVTRYYDGRIPGTAASSDASFWNEVKIREKSITDKLDKAELRDALKDIFDLCSLANKYFQDNEPWRLRNDNPKKAEAVIRDLTYIIRDLCVLTEPYLPSAAEKIASFFGLKHRVNLSLSDIGKPDGIGDIVIKSEVLFSKLEDKQIENLKERYSGTQKERQETSKSNAQKSFSSVMDLRAALIEKVERHPKADKLYILNLEIGEGVKGVREERQIVSGLVEFYKEEELLGKKIIVAYNLKPAMLRGIESKGMLLAAGDKGGADSSERCEVLDAGCAPTGTKFLPEGEDICALADTIPPEIDIDTFLSFPISVKDYIIHTGGKKLCLNGNLVRTSVIPLGEVH